MTKRYVRAAFVVLAAIAAACGGDSSPTAPTPPPPPPPINIVGQWIGTFESSNYNPEAMEAVFQQVGATVNGTYILRGPNVTGNLSGTIDASRFIGQITFNIGNACTIAGNIDGSVTASNLRWTSVGFATGSCIIANPTSVLITLARR